MENQHNHPKNDKTEPTEESIAMDPRNMDNAVLKRLIGEIDFEKENRLHAYNRTHNRHNRGR